VEDVKRLLVLLTNLAITVLALLMVDHFFDRISLDTWQTVLWTAAALALVNTYIRPLVVVLTLPLNILTLGLFTLVINALMLKLVAWLIPGFHIETFWTAVGAALVISLVSTVLNWLLRPNRIHVHIQHG
jgi:putative membrane protein